MAETNLREVVMSDSHPHELLKAHEVAQMLRVSRRHVYRMNEDGVLPAPILMGSQTFRWRRTDIESWLAGGGLAEAA